MGIIPRMVAKDVINTGRSRTRQDIATASRIGMPSLRSFRANSTIRIEFDTTMPVIITTPISDMTFSVVPVASRNRMTPVMPGGIAKRITTGSINEENCAIRMR